MTETFAIAQFGRRAGLVALAGAVLPTFARAQTVQSPLPTLQLPVLPPSRPTTSIDKSKIYYVLFNQNIDLNSMRLLQHQLAALVDAGVSEIDLVLTSVGGQVAPMLVTYSFIRALPAKIKTHAVAYLESAATILFLAGDERSADRNARFLFHPIASQVTATLDELQLLQRAEGLDAVVQTIDQILRDRTALTSKEIERFSREEVIYTAEQAQRAGVIESVADLKIPGDQRAKLLFLD